MKFGQAIASVFKNYATFEGRSRRSEFWYWALLQLIVGVGGTLVALLFFAIAGGFAVGSAYGVAAFFGGLSIFLYFLVGAWVTATLIPTYAVMFRRLHDTNRSGWYWALALVPLAGYITLIVLLARPGDTVKNDFGAAVA